MADEKDPGEQLHLYACKIVQASVIDLQLPWDEVTVEDYTQDLILEGWKVFADTGSLGNAFHRMRDRFKNVMRDDEAETEHEPETEADFAAPDLHQPLIIEQNVGDDPAELAEMNEEVANLDRRLRDVILLKGSGYTNREIADELEIGLRTVERELAKFRELQERYQENMDDDN